ncbi:MAG: hypothetical protein QGH72_05750 [Dehalococcoidia bacterium]|nr:hypothetical protein [Dehalococcoidia bacterium]
MTKPDVVFTPGHAPHHVSLWEPWTRTVFCGETMGSYLTSVRTVVPMVVVPFFDLSQALSSIDRAMDLCPEMLIFSQGGPCHRAKKARE